LILWSPLSKTLDPDTTYSLCYAHAATKGKKATDFVRQTGAATQVTTTAGCGAREEENVLFCVSRE
jgi:hypothetical protein